MGISHENGCAPLLNKTMGYVGKAMTDLSIAEFGDQQAKHFNRRGEMRTKQTHGALFRWFGARYVSFDTNGRHGAENRDLGHRIKYSRREARKWLGKFDIVTNFGTSEHIARIQYWVFRNADEMCKPGGYLVHCLPKQDCCDRHGYWKYSVEWFKWLAERQGYEIRDLFDHDMSNHPVKDYELGTNIYVMAVLKKGSKDFMSDRDWKDPKLQGLPLNKERKWK